MTPELLLSLGALLAVTIVLVGLLGLAVLVWLRVGSWLARHRKLFVERDDDGEIRFGGELRAKGSGWFERLTRGAPDLQAAMRDEREGSAAE
jgi:hypothetical protein